MERSNLQTPERRAAIAHIKAEVLLSPQNG